MEIDNITILNYPGSKKRLLDFIDSTISSLVEPGSKILDVFCGTCAVGYSLKRQYSIVANDAEVYCKEIANALLENEKFSFNDIKDEFMILYNDNYSKLVKTYNEVIQEEIYIKESNIDDLIKLYESFLNVWQNGFINRNCDTSYNLFTTYYSNSYFGIKQSIEIDSIRYAISNINKKYSSKLFSSLYFAMKECVFSKDGHMAQPLNMYSKKEVLLKRRKNSIIDNFSKKIIEFENLITNKFDNVALNDTLDSIIDKGIIKECDLVYADPPYTDMQYSRYFHLLETVTKYDYPKISNYRGKVSTGLYRENRFQSPLSQHGKAKKDIEKLVKYCFENNKKLVFSYAYPIDLETEKSDRYTMGINDLIDIFKKYYGEENTIVLNERFMHSNNRNSEAKKVYEYLIVGK